MRSKRTGQQTHTLTIERAEIELLLCCARTDIDEALAERIPGLLQQELDWGYLCQMAGRHRLLPLLFQGLNATCPGAVPETILSYLRQSFQVNAQRSLLMTGSLVKVLQVFAEQDIPAVAYKGPILAASVYGNLALRTFDDIDVLIRKQDFLKAKDVLLSCGYESEWTGLTAAQQAAVLQGWCEYGFVEPVSETSKIYLDLHWGFSSRYFAFQLDTDDLWHRLDTVPLAGREVANFSPEDLLLILCMHGTKEHWERLIWICDVAQLLSRYPGLDWAWVLARSQQLGTKRMLFLGLWLAHQMLAAPLPETIWQTIQPETAVKFLAEQVRQRLFCDRDRSQEHPFFMPFWRLRVRERWLDKARDSLMLIVPQPWDYLQVPLPASLTFLYYPIRLIEVLKRNGTRVLKLFR